MIESIELKKAVSLRDSLFLINNQWLTTLISLNEIETKISNEGFYMKDASFSPGKQSTK